MYQTRAVLLLLSLVVGTNGLVLDEGSSSEMELLKQKVDSLEETLYGLVDNLETECSLKCPSRRPVAFMAQLSASIVNPPKGQVVVWDQVHTNEGGAYDGSQGIFTAPVNGTYNFNIVASSPPIQEPRHWLHLFIMKNSQQVGYVFLDDNPTYWLRRTTDVTVHLVHGDTVMVQVADVLGNHTLGGCCFHSHFSGFLVSADN